jgi:hypothetical protein
MSKIDAKVTERDIMKMILQHLGQNPLGKPLLMPSRGNFTLLEIMMTST